MPPVFWNRLHDEAAAHGARDAGGKLQPGQGVLLGKAREARQRDPALGVDRPVGQQEEPVELRGADEKELGQPLVREEDVGAVAEHVGRELVLLEQVAQAAEARHVLRHGQRARRASDLEGAVRGHGLVLVQLEPGQGLTDLLYGKFQLFHGHTPDG